MLKKTSFLAATILLCNAWKIPNRKDDYFRKGKVLSRRGKTKNILQGANDEYACFWK